MIKFEDDYKDILIVEGILAKGFGHIPKYVMLDKDLSLEAKTIYAYFSSFAGGGSTAFPSRDTIIRDLKISKDRYYRHYNQLIDQGYISVKQNMYTSSDTGEHFLGKNIYTLISNPKKYLEEKENINENNSLGIKSMRNYGYGTIPKIVMLDNRLDIKSKGIYAYFSSYAGGGSIAFPEVKNTLYFLKIGKEAYYKYLNELIKCNYISVEQKHINGRLSHNNYYLNDNPDTKEVEEKRIVKIQCTENKDTGRNVEISSNIEVIHNQEIQCTENKDTGNKDTGNKDTQNKDTYNTNNINTNNINTNNHSIGGMEELINANIYNELIELEVENELLEYKKIPTKYLSDKLRMNIAIKLLTGYKEEEKYFEENKNKNRKAIINFTVYKLFVSSLVELLTNVNPQALNGSVVTYSHVYNKLHEYIEKTSYNGQIKLHIVNISEIACEKFIEASLKSKIANNIGYMKAIIWTSLLEGNSTLEIDVNRYFEN